MTADLIILNAHLPTGPRGATAVAVCGRRIAAVGSTADLRPLRHARTEVVDARGGALLPGLIDAHFHLEWGSAALEGAQLHDVQSAEQLADALRAWADAHPDAPWVLGRGLSYRLSPPHAPLTRRRLDAVIADRPLLISAYDMHALFCNTDALQAAGLLHGLPLPPHLGAVPLGADGLARGELIEMGAMQPALDALPPPTRAQRLARLRAGLAHAAALGLTGAHNMDGDPEQAALLAELDAARELTLRLRVPYWVRPTDTLAEALERAAAVQWQLGGPLAQGGAVKFFMDGVLESHTALLLGGYADSTADPDPIWSAEQFAAYATALDAAGYQIAVHACGDGAVRRVLDGLAAARRQNGPRDARHRIEHIELIDPADLPRLRALGVTASMQPLHAPDGPASTDLWLQRAPAERWPHGFAWRHVLEAGAVLALGSDWPVASADPLAGIAAAVQRQPWRPNDPPQALTLDEALAGYTRSAAYAAHWDACTGTIAPGRLADLTLLTDNIAQPTTAEPRVALTVCDGRIVYRAADLSA